MARLVVAIGGAAVFGYPVVTFGFELIAQVNATLAALPF